VLSEFQCAGHVLLQIADTPFSRALDEQRRRMWAEAGEPERPEHPPLRFLEDHGDHSTEPSRNTYGALSPPAEGYTDEQWAALTNDEQKAARAAEFARAAADQLAWEAKARREYDDRRGSDTSA
jgi:hypothetical protein